MKELTPFFILSRAMWVSLWGRFDPRSHGHPWPLGRVWATLALGILFALPASAEELQIDLNRADVSELCRLPGIGPKRAEAIVEMRRKKPFTRISQLLHVRGIGRKTLSRLRPLLYIDALGQIQRASSHPLRESETARAPSTSLSERVQGHSAQKNQSPDSG